MEPPAIAMAGGSIRLSSGDGVALRGFGPPSVGDLPGDSLVAVQDRPVEDRVHDQAPLADRRHPGPDRVAADTRVQIHLLEALLRSWTALPNVCTGKDRRFFLRCDRKPVTGMIRAADSLAMECEPPWERAPTVSGIALGRSVRGDRPTIPVRSCVRGVNARGATRSLPMTSSPTGRRL